MHKFIFTIAAWGSLIYSPCAQIITRFWPEVFLISYLHLVQLAYPGTHSLIENGQPHFSSILICFFFKWNSSLWKDHPARIQKLRTSTELSGLTSSFGLTQFILPQLFSATVVMNRTIDFFFSTSSLKFLFLSMNWALKLNVIIVPGSPSCS